MASSSGRKRNRSLHQSGKVSAKIWVYTIKYKFTLRLLYIICYFRNLSEKNQEKVMLFSNKDNILVKNINSKLTNIVILLVFSLNLFIIPYIGSDENFNFSLAELAVVTGTVLTVTVSAVEQRFMYNDFKSDEFTVKMAILYLVTNCLISNMYSKNDSFEILNSIGVGEYGNYSWGIPVYERTLHSLKIGLKDVKKIKGGTKPTGKIL
ncbi:hypothetical protein G4B88_012909 [Cannabis sativa]|uniref:Uncharacterized protein n=1 Tax=Cannabis sativa TaxID=3483 RepID=A0A7J6F553_CANSA|nr:hypothetical protein G4B88_012909 [Cannabis sativa]